MSDDETYRVEMNSTQKAFESLKQSTMTNFGPPTNFTFARQKHNYSCHVRDALLARGNWTEIDEEQAIESADLFWKQTNLGFRGYDKVDARAQGSVRPFIFNHFEVNRGICQKTGLIKSLDTYYKKHEKAIAAGYGVFDSTPTTFLISRGNDDQQINKFMHRFMEIQRGGSRQERVPNKHCSENIWIVKPAHLNQGRGIEIFKNMREISEFIFQKNQPHAYWVVQKYIEKPLLFKGRKFDLRIWATVTDDFRIYVYKQGYLRTCSTTYNVTDTRNNFSHLTNQCLQVNDKESYGKYEEGNTLSFAEWQEFLDETCPEHQFKVEEHFMPRIKDLIIDTFLCVRDQLNPNDRKHSFELFGLDFMVDEDYRIWLIEVNTNPYLGCPNNYMKKLVPDMIDDMLKIVLDPVCKPKNKRSSDQENNFELIYREPIDSYDGSVGVPAVNVRRPFSIDLCYPIPELKPAIGEKTRNRITGTQRLAKPSNTAPANVNGDNPKFVGQREGSEYATQQSPSQPTSAYQTTKAAAHLKPRSLSLLPTKPNLQLRKRGVNSATHSIERKSHYQSRQKSMTNSQERPFNQAASTLKYVRKNKIPEQVDEEDALSGDNSDEDFQFAKRLVQSNKRSLLCKNLLEQTKELCYQHSPVYKDFDSMFNRIINRFTNWMLFEDNEIEMAGKCLTVMANSGQIVNLVQQRNIIKLINFYDSEEIPPPIRKCIVDTYLIIAKNIGLRKIFLRSDLLPVLIEQALRILEEQKRARPSKLMGFHVATCNLLCMLCTVRTNKFYIPGETNLSERLRKRAFETGVVSLVTYLYVVLNENKQPFSEVRKNIRAKVLNFLELKDLFFHAKTLETIVENRQQSNKENKTATKIYEEEVKKDAIQEDIKEDLPDEEQDRERKPPHQILAQSTARKNNTMPAQSPRIRRNKLPIHANIGPFHSTAHTVEGDEDLFNDNKSVAEMWAEDPKPDFPPFLLKHLNLEEMSADILQKAEQLKQRIAQRQEQERHAQQQQAEKQKQEKMSIIEQKRKRLEAAAARREEMKKQNLEQLRRRDTNKDVSNPNQSQQAALGRHSIGATNGSSSVTPNPGPSFKKILIKDSPQMRQREDKRLNEMKNAYGIDDDKAISRSSKRADTMTTQNSHKSLKTQSANTVVFLENKLESQ